MKNQLFILNNVTNTEDFLNSKKQPINACPLIDAHLKKISELEFRLDFIVSQLDNAPINLLLDTPFYRYYITQFDEAREIISDLRITLEYHGSLIESMRSRCLSKREEIKELKNTFWANFQTKVKDQYVPYAKKPYYTEIDTFEFDIHSFQFTKHPDDGEFWGVNLKHIQLEGFHFDYSDLKKLLEALFDWGNDICEKMTHYHNKV